MPELKKDIEIKMEENKDEDLQNEPSSEDGATPTPSQDDVNDLQQEIDNLDNNSQQDASDSANEDLNENSQPQSNTEDDSIRDENLDSPQVDSTQTEPEPEHEKMLAQSQVNELVGKARKEGRESAMKELMSRYGVNNEEELDSIFGRGQAYDDLDYDFKNQGQSYKDAMAENALLKSHIDESRWEDVKLILGGKGLEVNAENISALLPSHPEWNGLIVNNQIGLGQENQILTEDMAQQMVDNQYQNAVSSMNAKKPGVLKKLGNEPTPPSRAKTEEEEAAELYGW